MLRASLFFLVSTSIMVAVSIPVGKFALLEVDPEALTVLRYAFAAAFLLAVRPAVRHADRSAKRLRIDPRHALLLGVPIAVYQILFFMGLSRIDTRSASVLNALAPVVTLLLAVALARERLNRVRLTGVLVCAVATAWYVSEGDGTLSGFGAGHALIFGAICCWSLFTIVVRRLKHRYSSFDMTLIATATCVGLVAPLCIALGADFLSGLSLRGWLAVAYMGIGPSGIAIILLNRCIKDLGPTLSACVIYGTTPFLVGALEWAIGGARPSVPFYACATVVILGLALALGGENGKKPVRAC